MLEIGKTIVSLDVLEEYFSCDLSKCKGACCIEGDSGAPLTKSEAKKIKEVYPIVKEYLAPRNNKAIEIQDLYFIDKEGDLVTSLVENRECVFSIREKKGVLKCAFEKAFLDGKTDFQKPLSCHLFPVRITEYKRFDAVNYEKLDICKPGRLCGASRKLPLYKFLQEPLTRKYGEEWFRQLEFAYNHFQEEKSKKI